MKSIPIKVNSLSFAYEPKKPVLKEISFELKKGEILGVIGPNGSGKSTLIRLLSGLFSGFEGEIFIQSRSIKAFSRKELAKILAVVPQQTEIAYPFRVIDVVLMGRAPYLGRLQWEGKKDLEIAQQALCLTETFHLAHRRVDELSGGERQRVILAKALAQEPKILLADEPTTYLDLHHQIRFMNLLVNLSRSQGLSVLFTTHNLIIASLFSDRIILLDKGKAVRIGTPAEVLEPELVGKVYSLPLKLIKNAYKNRPLLVPELEQ